LLTFSYYFLFAQRHNERRAHLLIGRYKYRKSQFTQGETGNDTKNSYYERLFMISFFSSCIIQWVGVLLYWLHISH